MNGKRKRGAEEPVDAELEHQMDQERIERSVGSRETFWQLPLSCTPPNFS